jgi:hypothetical protein
MGRWQPAKSPKRALIIFLFTIAVQFAIGAATLWLSVDNEWLGTVAGLSLASVATFLMRPMTKRGEQHFAASAEDVLAQDPRPPILYLEAYSRPGEVVFRTGVSQ